MAKSVTITPQQATQSPGVSFTQVGIPDSAANTAMAGLGETITKVGLAALKEERIDAAQEKAKTAYGAGLAEIKKNFDALRAIAERDGVTPQEITGASLDFQSNMLGYLSQASDLAPSDRNSLLSTSNNALDKSQFLVSQSLGKDGVMIVNSQTGDVKMVGGMSAMDRAIIDMRVNFPSSGIAFDEAKASGNNKMAEEILFNTAALSETNKRQTTQIQTLQLELQSMNVDDAKQNKLLKDKAFELAGESRNMLGELFLTEFTEFEKKPTPEEAEVRGARILQQTRDYIQSNIPLLAGPASVRDNLVANATALKDQLVAMGKAQTAGLDTELDRLKKQYEIRLWGMKNDLSDQEIAQIEILPAMLNAANARIQSKLLGNTDLFSDLGKAELAIQNMVNGSRGAVRTLQTTLGSRTDNINAKADAAYGFTESYIAGSLQTLINVKTQKAGGRVTWMDPAQYLQSVKAAINTTGFMEAVQANPDTLRGLQQVLDNGIPRAKSIWGEMWLKAEKELNFNIEDELTQILNATGE